MQRLTVVRDQIARFNDLVRSAGVAGVDGFDALVTRDWHQLDQPEASVAEQEAPASYTVARACKEYVADLWARKGARPAECLQTSVKFERMP